MPNGHYSDEDIRRDAVRDFLEKTKVLEALKELVDVPASDTARVLRAWDKAQAAIRAAEEYQR